MSTLIRIAFPLVAYLCVGTVISATVGYGYLRHTGRLDDDVMFRMVALVQGVDLDALAQEGARTLSETPPEEASFVEQQEKILTATLHFDAKQKQVAASLVEFEFQLKRLTEAQERYSLLRAAVENFLKKQQDDLSIMARSKVREQLEALVPRKQAKPILIKMVQDGRIDEVILLLGSMKPQLRKELLRTFDTPDDVDVLYQIQRHMLTEDPARPIIDAQLDALRQLKSQDR